MSALALTTTVGTVYANNADFVRDRITCTMPDNTSAVIPCEWKIDMTEADVVGAIELYIADPSITIEGNGIGFYVPISSITHPGAEITGQDFNNNLMNFNWINSVYNGECSVSFEFTLSTTAYDMVNAIQALI